MLPSVRNHLTNSPCPHIKITSTHCKDCGVVINNKVK